MRLRVSGVTRAIISASADTAEANRSPRMRPATMSPKPGGPDTATNHRYTILRDTSSSNCYGWGMVATFERYLGKRAAALFRVALLIDIAYYGIKVLA